MSADILQDTLNLLSANWDTSKTDGTTPSFQKITSSKAVTYSQNKDWVLAHRATTEMEPVGIGDVNKHEFENFNLDIRTKGELLESHWLNIIREIKRIIKSKKVNPLSSTYSETHVLEFNGTAQDLSNKTHHLWRKLLPIQFLRYKVIR
jgi:hypothetical protein